MAGLISRTCPACGVIVLREHHCRASALIPTTVPPRQVKPGKAGPAPAPRKPRRPMCPDHPTELAYYCKLCTFEAVAPPPDWRSRR